MLKMAFIHRIMPGFLLSIVFFLRLATPQLDYAKEIMDQVGTRKETTMASSK